MWQNFKTWLLRLFGRVAKLEERMTDMDTEVAKIKQAQAALTAAQTQLATDFAGLQAEVAALKAGGGTDFTALDAAIDQLGSSIGGLVVGVEGAPTAPTTTGTDTGSSDSGTTNSDETITTDAGSTGATETGSSSS